MGDDDQRRRVRLVQLTEYREYFSLGLLVEVVCRFVGQQENRLIDQGTGHGDTALLASGKLAGVGVPAIRQTYLCEQISGARVRIRLGLVAQQRGQCDVVNGAEVGRSPAN